MQTMIPHLESHCAISVSIAPRGPCARCGRDAFIRCNCGVLLCRDCRASHISAAAGLSRDPVPLPRPQDDEMILRQPLVRLGQGRNMSIDEDDVLSPDGGAPKPFLSDFSFGVAATCITVILGVLAALVLAYFRLPR